MITVSGKAYLFPKLYSFEVVRLGEKTRKGDGVGSEERGEGGDGVKAGEGPTWRSRGEGRREEAKDEEGDFCRPHAAISLDYGNQHCQLLSPTFESS